MMQCWECPQSRDDCSRRSCAVSPFDPRAFHLNMLGDRWARSSKSTTSASRGGDNTILDRVNWRVDRGEHWVILGANGSGKTSLLKALTGYLSPTAGEISLLGRRYGSCDWRDLRLQIGVVMSAFAASIPPAEPALDTVVSGKFAQLDLWHR